jgi:antitoxin component YwqK of YwqJK toxin-antitoxin module
MAMLKKYFIFIILFYTACLSAKGMERQFTIVNDPETNKPKQVYITGTKIKKDSKGNVIYAMSLKDGWKDGPTIRYDPDGSIIEEENFKKNVRVGLLNRYFNNGHLKQQTYFENGKKEGDEFIYDSAKKDSKTLRMVSHYIQGLKDGEQKSYSRGALKSITNYRADTRNNFSKRQGPSLSFGKNGKISSRGYYLDGQLHGLKQSYTKEGKLKKETCFQNGKSQKSLLVCKGGADKLETIKELHENGKLKLEYQVKNGMFNGYRKTYMDSGQLISEEYFSKDKKDGIETRYYDNGKKLSVFNWLQGLRNGHSEWYYMNGNPKKEFNYKEGLFHGRAAYFYDDGKIDVESNYKMGRRDGAVKSYFPDGKLAFELSYEDDKLEGVARFYTESKLTQEFVYNQGLLISAKEWDKDGKLKSENQYYADGSRIIQPKK